MADSFNQENSEKNDDGQSIDVMKKDLKGYHIQLITLGSGIGTRLFFATGQGLAGPIPLLAAFAFVGAALSPTIFALGEIAILDPNTGGFFRTLQKIYR